MPSEDDLARWERTQRSVGSDETSSIISGLALPPLPPQIRRAFPEVEAWEKQTNEQLRQFMTRLMIALRGGAGR